MVRKLGTETAPAASEPRPRQPLRPANDDAVPAGTWLRRVGPLIVVAAAVGCCLYLAIAW